MTDFRALCARMADELQEYINYAPVGPCDEEQALVDEARAALAEPQPAADDAVAATPDRLLEPIPVSDRLPEAGDCDEQGRCWWGRPESDDWSSDWTLATPEAIAEFCEFLSPDVWLPFNALPLPKEVE
jgi:hypothetical protein